MLLIIVWYQVLEIENHNSIVNGGPIRYKL